MIPVNQGPTQGDAQAILCIASVFVLLVSVVASECKTPKNKWIVRWLWIICILLALPGISSLYVKAILG